MTTEAITVSLPDSALLTMAKSVGLDEDAEFNDIWDMKKLNPIQKNRIVTRLHRMGYPNYENDDGFIRMKRERK